MSCGGRARFIGIWLESAAPGLDSSMTTAAGWEVRHLPWPSALASGRVATRRVLLDVVGWRRRLQPYRQLGSIVCFASPDELTVRQL
jgi:hypothetical protein